MTMTMTIPKMTLFLAGAFFLLITTVHSIWPIFFNIKLQLLGGIVDLGYLSHCIRLSV